LYHDFILARQERLPPRLSHACHALPPFLLLHLLLLLLLSFLLLLLLVEKKGCRQLLFLGGGLP